MRRSRRARRSNHEDVVIESITTHAGSMLRVARRYSLCVDDAQDAYQRALEIFLRRAGSLERDAIAGWLHTVVKHEALAVRRSRLRFVGGEEDELERQEQARGEAVPEERMEAFERVSHAAEALRRLKPQEMTALLLKAQGLSYEEIAARQGWTYTKVNRCLTEGRRAFRQRLAAIEAGDECERWVGVLSAIADGEASAAELTEVRPHLRNCAGCRATLRDFQSAPREVAAVVPVGVLALAHADGGSLVGRLHELITGGVPERVLVCAQKLQGYVEAGSPAKVAAVAASATALAGGVAVERAVQVPRRGPAASAGAAPGPPGSGGQSSPLVAVDNGVGGWPATGESQGSPRAGEPARRGPAAGGGASGNGDASANGSSGHGLATTSRLGAAVVRGAPAHSARPPQADEFGFESGASVAPRVADPVRARSSRSSVPSRGVGAASSGSMEFGSLAGSASSGSFHAGGSSSSVGSSTHTPPSPRSSAGAQRDATAPSTGGDEFGM